MLANNSNLYHKSLRARIEVAHVKLFQEIARLVPRCAVTSTYENQKRRRRKKNWFSGKKKSKTTKQFFKEFRKAVIYNSIPDALPTSECKRPHNKTYDGCLWKPTERNKVRTSKQLRIVGTTETFNGNQFLHVSLIA